MIHQGKQIYKIEQENYELKPEQISRKIRQIKYMKIEEREKLSKFTLDKKAKILINRVKIATKEILRACEETPETMNKVIYAGGCVVTE